MRAPVFFWAVSLQGDYLPRGQVVSKNVELLQGIGFFLSPPQLKEKGLKGEELFGLESKDRHTTRVFPPRDFEELFDVGDFGRHGCGVVFDGAPCWPCWRLGNNGDRETVPAKEWRVGLGPFPTEDSFPPGVDKCGRGEFVQLQNHRFQFEVWFYRVWGIFGRTFVRCVRIVRLEFPGLGGLCRPSTQSATLFCSPLQTFSRSLPHKQGAPAVDETVAGATRLTILFKTRHPEHMHVAVRCDGPGTRHHPWLIQPRPLGLTYPLCSLAPTFSRIASVSRVF